MARKSGADAAKEKAAKQKKLAIGLSAFLLLAMLYAVHTMMSLNSGGSKPVAADTSTTPASSSTTTPATTTPAPTATPTATPTGTPSLAAPSLAGSPTTTTDSQTGAPTTAGGLVSAVVPSAGVGQLQSFSEFNSKDPFSKSATPSSTPAKTKPSGTKKPAAKPAPTKTATPTSGSGAKAPTAVAPTSAVISVNGTAESVAAGASFPASNPLFQLLSLTKTTAKVTVVGGSYASGAASLTLTVNKSVTLVNTADGTRYTLLLFPQGTAPPAASAASTAAPATSTTPTQTTTN
jgi:hypothetical protein